jgi:hypothetical protein
VLYLYDNSGLFLHKEFYNLEGNRGFDTGVSSSQYACAIVGWPA